MSQVVLISGASTGIGLAIGVALQQAGFTVYGTSRNPERFPDSSFSLLSLDVTDPAAIDAMLDELMARERQIDVLINNAGYDLYGAAEETSLAELTAQMDTNFFGVARLTTAILPAMRARSSGKIINIGSIGGMLSLPFNSAYAASKFALEGYSESLRLELLQYGIYVSLVEPAAVQTETLATSIRPIATPNSTYTQQRTQMIDHMRQMGQQSSVTPAQVARTVLRIVQHDRPKLRYPVGRDAHFLPVLKQLTPQRLFERIVLNQFPVGTQAGKR